MQSYWRVEVRKGGVGTVSSCGDIMVEESEVEMALWNASSFEKTML